MAFISFGGTSTTSSYTGDLVTTSGHTGDLITGAYPTATANGTAGSNYRVYYSGNIYTGPGANTAGNAYVYTSGGTLLFSGGFTCTSWGWNAFGFTDRLVGSTYSNVILKFKSTNNYYIYFGRGTTYSSGSMTDSGGGSYSGIVGMRLNYYDAPSAPTGMTASSNNDGGFTLNFTPGSNGGTAFTGYRLAWSTSSTFATTTGTTEVNSNPTTLNNLSISGGAFTPGQTYYFRIAAKNYVTTTANGGTLDGTYTGAYSNISSGVVSKTAPDAPTISGSTGASATGLTATVTVGFDNTDTFTNNGDKITKVTVSAYSSATSGGTYTLYSSQDVAWSSNQTTGTATFSALPAAKYWKFSATATNTLGTSSASGYSNIVQSAAYGYRYVNGSWQPITTAQRYINGAWVDATYALRYNNGAWETSA